MLRAGYMEQWVYHQTVEEALHKAPQSAAKRPGISETVVCALRG